MQRPSSATLRPSGGMSSPVLRFEALPSHHEGSRAASPTSFFVDVHLNARVHSSTPIHWYTGILAHRYPGTPIHGYTKTSAQRYTGTQRHWYTNALVHKYTGIPIHWYTGTEAHRYTTKPDWHRLQAYPARTECSQDPRSWQASNRSVPTH